MSAVRKFFTQFSHFITGMGMAQLLSFISFPILTRVLTKEQYGILGLVTTTMLIAVAVSKAGLSDGIIRLYGENSSDTETLTVFSTTVLIRGLVFAVVTVVLYLLTLPVLRHFINIDTTYLTCFGVMAAYLFIRPLNIIAMNFMRVKGKTIFMNALNVCEKALSIGLSLFLLLFVVHELYGYFIGVVISEFVAGVVLFTWFFRTFPVQLGRVSGDLAKRLIKFGLPLLFSECAFLALSYADRYLIVAYHGEAMLGLYAVGYNLAMYIANIITFSISYAIVPIYLEVYNKEGKEKTEVFLQKSMHYLLIAFIPICFGYIAVSKDLFITLASEKYAAAAFFSPVILVGYMIFAMGSLFNAGLYLAKRTMTMLGIMLFAVAVNITMNILLLPSYGTTGAAIANLTACSLATFLGAFQSRKYLRINLEFNKLIYYLALSSVMFLIVLQIHIATVWISLIVKVLAGVIIICIGTLYKENELREKLKRSLNWA